MSYPSTKHHECELLPAPRYSAEDSDLETPEIPKPTKALRDHTFFQDLEERLARGEI